jgi:signal transduction histidine kinase
MHGLLQVTTGPDPRPPWHWRSPGQRWSVYLMLGAVTLALCAACPATRTWAFSMGGGSTSSGHGAQAVSAHGAYRSSFSLISVLTMGGMRLPDWMPGTAISLGALTVLGVMAPMVAAVRHPLAGWRIAWLAVLLAPLLDLTWWAGLPWNPVQIVVLLVVTCLAGVRHGRQTLCWLWALTLVPWWFWTIRGGPGVVTAVVGTLAFGAIGVAVDSVHSRRRTQVALADQAEAVEAERDRRAVLEERARIARELHDVVAHHMSLLAIRAESAPYRLGELPGPVRDEFGWLSGSAREALADMRRLLGVLRSDQPAARTPQPGLSDVPELIAMARQAGMTVDLSPLPAPDQVAASAGVCAYRIIQEALSNAGRHAAGTPVTVSMRQGAGSVTLRVANGPDARARTRGTRPGHGLAGMRERVELLGGTLSAGPEPDGGFVVSAVLPLTESVA